jgi:DNA primase
MNSLEDVKKRILMRVNLANLISRTVTLKDRSGLKVGLCPFHEEKGESFTVYPDNHYFCFGCRVNGDAITFVRKINGLGFVEALRYLAKEFSVDAPELSENPQMKKEQELAAQLFKVLIQAQNVFTSNLHSPRGAMSIEYLKKRGFSEENVKNFGFGLAANEPTQLLDSLTKIGTSTKFMELASLVSYSAKNAKPYDFYRNRLMIPIHDVFGRLVGFGGRAMDDYPPKYKNSRESQLFDKSSLLFGLHRAKDAMRRGGPAIVVEGYMDALMLWQFGFHTAVACMGTALSKQHLATLSNFTSQVILLFDGDSAGQKANLSTVANALEIADLNIKVVTLPEKEDPDSFLLKNGAEALQNLLNTGEELLDFAIKAKITAGGSMASINVLRKEILPWLSKIPDRLQRSFLMNKVTQLTGISGADLEVSMRQLQANPHDLRNAAVAHKIANLSKPLQPLSPLEFDLIGNLFFAESQEIDAAEIKSFVSSKLNLDDVWLEFIGETLEKLAAGRVPAQDPVQDWRCHVNPSTMALMQRLLKMAVAFKANNRKDKLVRLIRQHELEEHQKLVAKLRAKLALSSQTDALEILKSISLINNDIKTLETILKI